MVFLFKRNNRDLQTEPHHYKRLPELSLLNKKYHQLTSSSGIWISREREWQMLCTLLNTSLKRAKYIQIQQSLKKKIKHTLNHHFLIAEAIQLKQCIVHSFPIPSTTFLSRKPNIAPDIAF